MSDLISRSDVLELQRYSFGVSMLNSEEYIKVSDVDNILTAYDIDKIVEKLEKIRAKKTCNKEKCDTKEICRICVVDDAIEIVKQGGVGKDVE